MSRTSTLMCTVEGPGGREVRDWMAFQTWAQRTSLVETKARGLGREGGREGG